MPDLSSKVAVVTGSTRGIGRAIARALLGAGARVVVSSRSAEAAEETARKLADEGPGEAMAVPCDVRRPADCAGLVESTVERFGRLDVLVNNAGVGRFAPIQHMTNEDFRAHIDTNLCGVFYCSRAAVPHLVATGDGWIINVGSLAGRNPFAGGIAYNASKFGLLGMTEAMMLDLRHEGIRVSLIMPGSVDTGFRDNTEGDRPWALKSDDVARATLDLLALPPHAHVSRVEMRPSKPPQR